MSADTPHLPISKQSIVIKLGLFIKPFSWVHNSVLTEQEVTTVTLLNTVLKLHFSTLTDIFKEKPFF